MARAYPRDKPDVYASEYLPTVRDWWNGPIGRIMRAYTPKVFPGNAPNLAPGAPPEAMMGFASNGGSLRSNTTGWLTGLQAERDAAATAGRRPLGGTFDGFHELGLFGVEGGPASGPAPAVDSPWGSLAHDATVRELLSRDGTVVPGGWVSAEDQIAIGLVNVRRHGRTVKAAIPASIRPTNEDGLWFVALAFMGWSAGDPRAARHISAYAEQLAGIEEKARWGAFGYLLAKDLVNGTKQPGEDSSHSNPAYSVTRTNQKLLTGQKLAVDVHGNVAWFDDCIYPQIRSIVDDVLARAAVGQAVRGTFIPPSAMTCAPLSKNRNVWIVGGVTAVAAVAAVAAAWKFGSSE